MSERIELDDDTYESLASLRGPDETFDDVVSRLLERRRERVRRGADTWAGTDAAQRAREAREDLKRDVGDR